MKNIKTLICTVLAVLTALSVCSCTKKNDVSPTTPSETVKDTQKYQPGNSVPNVAIPKDITGIFSIFVLDGQGEGKNNVELVDDVEASKAALKSGDADIAVMPVNAAVELYNETNGEVTVIALTNSSSFSILEKGQSVKKASDLSGKTVYACGKNTMIKPILETALKRSKVENVEFDYSKNADEIVDDLKAGNIDLALLPEPYATYAKIGNEDIKKALSASDIWNDAMLISMAENVMVVSKEYLDSYEGDVNLFISDCIASVNAIENDASAAAKLAASYGFVKDEKTAKAVLKNSGISIASGDQARSILIQMFDAFGLGGSDRVKERVDIGGDVPSDDFYYVN